MPTSIAVLTVLLLVLSPASAAEDDACAELDELVAETYDFRPGELSAEEQAEAAEAMDVVWDLVRSRPEELVPCLRAALVAPDADRWFRVDGSALLLEVAGTVADRELQVRLWTEAAIQDDVDPRMWLETLAQRGREGFDVSAAAERWLEEQRSFQVTEHGMFPIGPMEGALMLYGSMDESVATPALVRFIETRPDPRVQMVALQLLAFQGTEASWAAMAELDIDTLPPEARPGLQRMIETSPPAVPAPEEPIERERLVAALVHCIEDGGYPLPNDFGVDEMGWATQLCHQLEPEDVALVRLARRRLATQATDESIMVYMVLSSVLNYHVRGTS